VCPLFAQIPIKKDIFLFPIMPGQANSLTGNMGEIRGNHFHGGLDIRTKYTTGLPIVASNDGYVWKVIMDSQGYGKVMYIRHPDGFVTLYAHLEDFYIPLAKYIREKQYERQSFQIELILKPDQFPVKKGDLVAYSGNTGSSAGPHLHWEIRDTTDAIYNPLLFGFPEVKDNKAPYVVKIGIRPMSEPTGVTVEKVRHHRGQIGLVVSFANRILRRRSEARVHRHHHVRPAPENRPGQLRLRQLLPRIKQHLGPAAPVGQIERGSPEVAPLRPAGVKLRHPVDGEPARLAQPVHDLHLNARFLLDHRRSQRIGASPVTTTRVRN
jgi:murein DD-endopeptidase MepM/ murein hydrolase activator NlpD